MSGRKEKVLRVPAEHGRDTGKIFKITEMPATRAEKWGWRMMLLFQSSREAIPQNIVELGMVGVALVGLNAFLRANIPFEKLEPLLDEMITCVQMVRDPNHPDVATPLMAEDDIQEIKTLLWIRSEVLELHTGFSVAEAASKLFSAINQVTTETP